MDKWVVSSNEEHFGGLYFDSKEEAIEEGKACYDSPFYVGKIKPYKPYFSANMLIEQLGENAWDDCGEVSEDWPTASKNDLETLQKKLDKLVSDFLKETNNEPYFFSVVDVEKHDGKGEDGE